MARLLACLLTLTLLIASAAAQQRLPPNFVRPADPPVILPQPREQVIQPQRGCCDGYACSKNEQCQCGRHGPTCVPIQQAR